MIPILKYPSQEAESFLKKLNRRAFLGIAKEIENQVEGIIERVLKEGDKAILDYTRRFDWDMASPEKLIVSEEEMERALRAIDQEFLEIIRIASRNIANFHERQLEKSWFITGEGGVILGQMVSSVDSTGIYVPGGKGGNTPLISSLLMGAIPAKIAGVRDIVVATPPRHDGSVHEAILATALELGIKTIYRMGSAWAIAALAFGTESVKKVDVIVGPGNIYVATAKRILSGVVGIDLLAGPSEILIISDKSATPDYIAADLLSQAEHDPIASAMLITTDESLAKRVIESLTSQLKGGFFASPLPRKDIATESLRNYGACFLVDNLETAINLSNRIAPEHLELHVEDPWSLIGLIRCAGAVFIGQFTPEPVGDYFAGPNHVLPTAGTARFSSALGVHSFLKKTSIIHYPLEATQASIEKIARFARMEGLEAHARSMEIRRNYSVVSTTHDK
ncbi:MAG: histidinol dehydrogenase [Syntrophobacterales bacterium]|nr:histidinol dehydrogenase [Syntrophobacterales bacterium]